MKAINYQGQSIQAETVAYIDGNFTTAILPEESTLEHQGREDLFRDAEGRYYLRRELCVWDVDGTGERTPQYGEHMHRLSTKAAILWTVMRANPVTNDLRREARDVLAGPAVLNPTRRFSDGSMVVSLHLKPAVASLVRAVAEAEDDTPLGIIYTGMEQYVIGALVQGGGRDRERDLEALFADHAPEENQLAKRAKLRLLAPDGAVNAEAELSCYLLTRLQKHTDTHQYDWQYTLTNLLEDGLRMANEWVKIVELDDVAETLLRRYHRQEYGEARYENVMPGDVVNGVLVNWLEATLKIHEGRTDGDAIEEARSRRRHGLSDEDNEVIKQAEEANEDGPCTEYEIVVEKTENKPTNVAAVCGFTLEPKAAKLLAKYSKLAPDLDPQDVVNAAMIYMLEAGIEGLKIDPEGRDVEVAAARRRRIRREGHSQQAVIIVNTVHEFEDGAVSVTVHFKPEPANLLRREAKKYNFSLPEMLYDGIRFYITSDLKNSAAEDRETFRIFAQNAPDANVRTTTNRVRYPAREPEATALHGLNAAAPEAVSEEEIAAVRQGNAVPVRDLLADLATEWRIKAAEARATGQDATPFPASHKLHGQADLLEQCANEIEAIASGKEGR